MVVLVLAAVAVVFLVAGWLSHKFVLWRDLKNPEKRKLDKHTALYTCLFGTFAGRQGIEQLMSHYSGNGGLTLPPIDVTKDATLTRADDDGYFGLSDSGLASG